MQKDGLLPRSVLYEVLRKKLTALLVLAAVVGPAATAAASGAYPIGAVNVRSGPGTQYGVVAVLREGERASVLSHEGQWLKVRTPSGATGFMADWFTREVFDDETVFMQVDAAVLNLRSGPGVDYAVLGQLRQGQRLRAVESLGGWYKLDAGALGTGWASGEFLYRAPQPPASQPSPQPPPEKPPTMPEVGLTKTVMAANATPMYSGRDVRFDQVASVQPGEMLTYLSAEEGWVKVKNRAGKQGWTLGTQVYLWDGNLDFSQQVSYGLMENDWRMRYQKVREVVQGVTGLGLRTGQSATSPVKRTLVAGDRMKLLQVPDSEYVQVTLPDGDTGWLSRNFIKPVPGLPTEAVRLYRVSENVLRLEVTGQSAAATVRWADDRLEVSMPANSLRKASLPVGQYDVAGLEFGSAGLTARFDQPFNFQVIEQSATTTVIELRPNVEKITAIQGADRTTYRFTTLGNASASATLNGGDVVLTLPGALFSPKAGEAPAGLRVAGSAAGVTARVATNRPYAVKRGPGYVDLVIYAPGLSGKVIALDAGHGGSETGAVGPAGLLEKEPNLAITLKLANLLESAGAKVVLTRGGDTRCASPEELASLPPEFQLRFDLNCRAVTANTAQVDASLSVHNNASSSSAERGTETYWTRENLNATRSSDLAWLVQRELVGTLGLQDRRMKEDMYYVIKYTDAPAALAEVAFVSNPTEEGLLRQDAFRTKTAEALFRAMQGFFSAR